MLKRTLSLACTLVLLLSMCGCSRQLSETPNAPAETSALEEVTPTPEPADAMNGIYSVKTQEDTEKILEQAYEGMVTQLNFSFPTRPCPSRTGIFSYKMQPIRL